MSDNRSLEGKTILIMGVANPWSIAYAIGQDGINLQPFSYVG